MEKPYRELARLVGRVLAKRWLNRTAKQDTPPDAQPKTSRVSSRDEPVADIAEAGNTPRV